MPLTTTTIGSYPKPESTPVGDWFLANKSEEEKKASKGLLENWTPGSYENSLQEAGDSAEERFLMATEEIIRDQVNAGIDVPTDGEVRRENYIHYQCRRLNGISFQDVTHRSVRDAYEADLPTIVSSISLKETRLDKDWKVAQQFTKNPVKITLPGPMTIADSIANTYYSDEKIMGVDLASALNKEVKALAEAGCRYIQVDEPVFARRPEEALEYGFENLERTLHGVPKEINRVVHMCCGYPSSLDEENYKKADKDAYVKIISAIEDSTIDEVSIEDAHRHNDLRILEKFSKTKVILGVINIGRSRMESVEEVRSRLLEALGHIDPERLIAGPDCGLGFFTREQAITKMKVMSEAARSI
ncbi:MAG: 5-methyltetrahydropteroyltriglutamate--homocysteine methyltransferase [Magnetovibrio sp.]|nr:5-methyltetrahydropteroyltriglutamate--homocysteine methyltransferase [Magnetovibrio sp.]